MITRVSMANVAFKGYISDNIVAARCRVNSKKMEIEERKDKPLPTPPKRNLLMRHISKPVATQESELKRLDSELLTESKQLRYYQNMRRRLKRLGVSEEFLDKFATALHDTYCSGYRDVYYQCSYNAKSISTSDQISETDEVMQEAITILKRLKKSGFKINAEQLLKNAGNLPK